MCMAVGTNGNPLTETWNGSRWTVRPSADPHGPIFLRAVTCPRVSFCMAVGADNTADVPFAESWNGSRWTRQTIPSVVNGDLEGVACSSSSSCVAVGTQQSGTLGDVWNGKTWTQTPMPFPGPGEILFSVACPTATFCTAVGNHRAAPPAFSALLAEQWNGTKWTLQTFTDPSAGGSPGPTPRGVSCASPSGCSAVGFAKSVLAERWNGTVWQ